jgi:hypothetical protein
MPQKKYLEVTKKFFSDLVKELEEYGKASNISFSDMRILCLEDDLDET